MRLSAFLLLVLLVSEPLPAQPVENGGILTRRELQELPPAQIATKVLGALATLVEDENGVGGIQIEKRGLENVALGFPARPTAWEGLCLRRWLVAEFKPVDPATFRLWDGAEAPVRASGFFTNEFYRVVRPLGRERHDSSAEDTRARNVACAEGSATARYFAIDDPKLLWPAVQAVQEALVKLKGVTEATALLGELISISTDSCGDDRLQRICVTAFLAKDGKWPDFEAHELIVADVRFDSQGDLLSIGNARFGIRSFLTD